MNNSPDNCTREIRVVVFDGTAPEKTGPKDGTKFCGLRKMLQTSNNLLIFGMYIIYGVIFKMHI